MMDGSLKTSHRAVRYSFDRLADDRNLFSKLLYVVV
jgi:hypothetical protein